MNTKIQESARLFTLATVVTILLLFFSVITTQPTLKRDLDEYTNNSLADVKTTQPQLLIQKYVFNPMAFQPKAETHWMYSLPIAKVVGYAKVAQKLILEYQEEK